MDLRHDQLPWNEQIWAKINADLAHALAQARRARAPFEVFHVPSDSQTVMADRAGDSGTFRYSDATSLPVVQLSVQFLLRESQVFNEGQNFFSLDRIIQAAYQLGVAEDWLILRPNSPLRGPALANKGITITDVPTFWEGLYYPGDGPAPLPRQHAPIKAQPKQDEVGVRMFDYVIEARSRLRAVSRYEPYALILSSDLEGEISATTKKGTSLSTPIERMKPLVTGGIHSSPAMPPRTALVVSCVRAWMDVAQALEPSVQFVRINEEGHYVLRLVERFTFRLKDRDAVCAISVDPR